MVWDLEVKGLSQGQGQISQGQGHKGQGPKGFQTKAGVLTSTLGCLIIFLILRTPLVHSLPLFYVHPVHGIVKRLCCQLHVPIGSNTGLNPPGRGGGLKSFSLAKIANLFIYEYDLLIDI